MTNNFLSSLFDLENSLSGLGLYSNTRMTVHYNYFMIEAINLIDDDMSIKEMIPIWIWVVVLIKSEMTFLDV
jgi:hypothetical protein